MTESKKYYWLKLKDDFFAMKEVKKLRKIAGGDTYTIIYLKMQLLSVKHGGLLIYDKTENDIAEQLALELDESIENVRMTLSYLQANNLIEQITEDEYLLNKVPHLIGSETDAAERMRNLRARKRISEHSCNNVTDERNDVTQRKELYLDTEKKKEKEKEEEASGRPDYQPLFAEFWELYPKKVNKKKAQDKYFKLMKDKVEHSLIINGLKNYIAYLRESGTKPEFIKHPTTWLNGECWDDELDIMEQGTPEWLLDIKRERGEI